MKLQHSKILFIILIFGFLTSCNSVKRLAEKEHLLTKTVIKVNDKNEQSETINNLLYQKPNNSLPLVGIPLRLYIYNWARPNLDSILKERTKNNPKKTARLQRFLSKKQYAMYIENKLSFNKWLKRTGAAPVIVNDSLSKKTLKRLESYYWNNGWLDVKADFETIKNDNQRATVNYKVTTGKPYTIDSLSTKIETPIIDSLYQNTLHQSFIKKNAQYKTNTVISERDRITYNLRNSGIYHFSQDNIYFEMDTIGKTKKVNVELQISERPIRLEDTTLYEPFKIYKIKDVNIYTNNSFESKDNPIVDSTTYKGYTIYSKEKLRYNPKMLTNAIFIKPNSIFKDNDQPLTSRRISNLKTFEYPKIVYKETSDSTLNANIYLNPKEKFGLSFSAEASQSNIQTIGFSLNPSILLRNVFRGAETLELSGIASIGASKDGINNRDRFFDINEIGANLKLTIPRLLSPFNTEKIIPNAMFPSTQISIATTSQTNVGLDKQTLTSTFNYRWRPNKKVFNRFDLFNIQYIKNKNTEKYYDIYPSSYNTLNQIASVYNTNSNFVDASGNLIKTILPQGLSGADLFALQVILGQTTLTSTDLDYRTVNNLYERKTRLTDDNLIISSSYSYEIDKRENLADNNFSIFKSKIELAGNLLSLFAKPLNLKKNNNNNFEVFNLPFSQFVKTDFTYIKHWELNSSNVLAFRSFLGIAIPYGNSNSIPFSKSFFGGGPNDNRAWTPYGLGPGDSNNTNDFNEANLKLAFNLEHRFDIFGAFKGALFIDTGNIWNVGDFGEEYDTFFNENTSFTGVKSLKNTAIGSGFGIRYDFSLFVFRFDVGFKTYDPSRDIDNRWFKDYNFGNAVYNIGINYPF